VSLVRAQVGQPILGEVSMSDGGKGSRPRPLSVDQKTFDSNWDTIFNRQKKTEQEKFDEQVIMKDEYYDLDDEGSNLD
jgi:hypothetical protein